MKLMQALTECAENVEAMMSFLLPDENGVEPSLAEAMRYSCLGSGKRLRPFMVEQSAQLFGVNEKVTRRVGAAVEFLHCYSLIHDDLPAMDNSDLRRGKPSCHKKFNEETAILAGDALLTLAFEVLSEENSISDNGIRCELMNALARAAGCQGMVAGQMVDLLTEGKDISSDEIIELQRLKTGKVFSFCMLSGGIIGRATCLEMKALSEYADGFGIAFQIIDDLLDLKSSPEITGKPVGQDAIANKATLVSILGVDEAHRKAVSVMNNSIAALDNWGSEADHLRALGHFILERQR